MRGGTAKRKRGTRRTSVTGGHHQTSPSISGRGSAQAASGNQQCKLTKIKIRREIYIISLGPAVSTNQRTASSEDASSDVQRSSMLERTRSSSLKNSQILHGTLQMAIDISPQRARPNEKRKRKRKWRNGKAERFRSRLRQVEESTSAPLPLLVSCSSSSAARSAHTVSFRPATAVKRNHIAAESNHHVLMLPWYSLTEGSASLCLSAVRRSERNLRT